jgi:hypothetical protein
MPGLSERQQSLADTAAAYATSARRSGDAAERLCLQTYRGFCAD